MKRVNLFTGGMLLISAFLLGGCYTQIAVPEHSTDKEKYDYDTYYESYPDSEYTDFDQTTINDYYLDRYPFYRRYFGSYYPSLSIGGYIGYWYDPFYWDYYYSNYCCFNYFPGYYYSPWYYHNPYYYGGYYGGYYGTPGFYVTKERSRETSILRNNDGLRNGRGRGSALVRPGVGISVGKTTINRNGSVTGRTPNRDTDSRSNNNRIGVRDGSNGRNIDKEGITRDAVPKKRTNAVDNPRESVRKKAKENVRNNSTRNENKSRYERIRKEYEQYIKREKSLEKRSEKKRPEINSGNNKPPKRSSVPNRSGRSYERKHNDQPTKSYTPPKKSYSPPARSSSPRQRSTPPARGNSRSSSRDSGNGRR